MFTSHPPKVPYPLCDIHPFIHSAAACLTTNPVPNSKAWKGKPFLQASNPSGQPQKALGQGLAQNGCFPMIPEGTFHCQPASRQSPKIWLQKAPGQDVAQNGCFPMIPEGTFHCRPASRQSPKIWLQKAPGQDLAQNGCFPMIPEGAFYCRFWTFNLSE